MKHKVTPVPGAHGCVHICAGIRRLAGIAGLAIAALAASSPTLAQVIVSIEASDASAAENPPDPGQFTIRRVGGDPLSSVRVALSVSGSASEGVDYSPLPDTVQLSFGQQRATVDVTVGGDDAVFEGDESVTVKLEKDKEGEGGGDVVIQNDTATVTIADSSYGVSVAAGENVTEGSGDSGEFVVTLSGRNESGKALDIEYTVAGSAEPGSDYKALSGKTTIAGGTSTAPIEVKPVDDDVLENDKTVELRLTGTSDSRVTVDDPSSATLTIADDEAIGDDDGDGLSNLEECPDITSCRDTDQDGMPDYQDPDDDGDGVPTASENPPEQDTDDDGTPDYLDDDDDGDGRPTAEEDENLDGDGNPATNPTDADDDGIPDYLDADDGGGAQGDPDDDGLTNQREEELGTDPQNPDTDGDGVNDGDEVSAGTDPLDDRSFEDTDGDLVPDAVEAADSTDPEDPEDFLDSDVGGTADHIETVTYPTFGLPATDPAKTADDRRDFDGDGLPDRLELALGSDPDSSDSPTGNGGGDDNGDGVSNAVEAYLADLGISPIDAVSDFDRDGYPDGAEVRLGLDPRSSAAKDGDRDGVPNIVEALAGVNIDSSTDSDKDGVPDAREIALGANPLDANSPVANGAQDDDGDGVSNAIEDVLQTLGASDDISAGSDIDGDGLADADEVHLGSDPFHDEQPVPWIELAQADFGAVRAISIDGGEATAIARIGGYQTGLSFDWSGTSDAVLAVSSGSQNAQALSFA
ncbi:MAG TPA: Calx-beta domain-containing protein, partial [Woeseiaceae bacterium]|nr:Calx-beta domain-containing protein [Woeseiaceae bacterium]